MNKMNKKVVFTICAKNYLAQALSLKESTLRHNDVDFHIFLSDDVDSEVLPEVVKLEESWIPNWRNMAFKYDVIEFSTSIKPYCFKKLFEQGYEKVCYLDPDIYVFNCMDVVFEGLNEKSILLTPHRCHISNTEDDMISEQMVSSVGIYNCGFIAVKNNKTGNDLVDWWIKRLSNQCLCDLAHGLFVDQKWIDFVPGFFPKDVLISDHLGLNVATWNLQERQVYEEDGHLFVRSPFTKQVFPLIFFHFSGYNPHNPMLLHKRKEKSDLRFFPEMKRMVAEYREAEMRNEYERYSKMKYSFNIFSDGISILSFHRRLYYRNLQKTKTIDDPFDCKGYLYALYTKRGLIDNKRHVSSNYHIAKMSHMNLKQISVYSLLRLLGIKCYLKLLEKLSTIASYSYYDFLVTEELER